MSGIVEIFYTHIYRWSMPYSVRGLPDKTGAFNQAAI